MFRLKPLHLLGIGIVLAVTTTLVVIIPVVSWGLLGALVGLGLYVLILRARASRSGARRQRTKEDGDAKVTPDLDLLSKIPETLGPSAEVFLAMQRGEWEVVATRLASLTPDGVEQILVTLVILSRVTEARRLALLAREILGDHGLFSLHEGICAQLTGDLPTAQRCYEQALSDPHPALLAEVNLASVQAAQGDFSAAAASVEPALEREPMDLQIRSLALWLNRLAHNDATAARLLDDARALPPRSRRALTALLEVPLDTHTPWVQRFISHADLAYQTARGYLDHDLPEAAEQFFRRALELDPWHLLSAADLTMALAAQHDDQRALVEVQAAIERIPGSDMLHFNEGSILLRLGRVDEALGAFQACLDYREDWLEPRINLISVLSTLGRREEAKLHWTTLRKMGAQDDLLARLRGDWESEEVAVES